MSGLQPLPGTSVWGQVLFSKTCDIVKCLTSCTGMKGHMQRESYRLSLNCGISKIYQENDRIQTLGILLGKKKKKSPCSFAAEELCSKYIPSSSN